MTDLLLIAAIILLAMVLGGLARLLYLMGPMKVARPDPSPYPQAEEFTEEEARAIDPADPPRYQVYRPKHLYDINRAPKCTCHGLPIREGEKVLLWPIPNHPDGAIDVFCAETYERPEVQ